MNECPYISNCVLFRQTLKGLPQVAMLMKARHCRREYCSCALYKIASELGPEQVPAGLYPNQTARAELILRGHCDKKSPPELLYPESFRKESE